MFFRPNENAQDSPSGEIVRRCGELSSVEVPEVAESAD